jgi:phospholipid/cholesterol/gamma-HCH transport system substrate-binding protein
MEKRANVIAAGAFILLMGVALAAVVAWFESDRTELVRYTIATHSAVSGLAVKAPVKLRGVQIGRVDRIGFDPADTQQILVTIAVDKAAPLTAGTYAKLGVQGVTGLAYVDLEDNGKDLRRFPSSGGPHIELQPSALDKVMDAAPDLVAGFAQSAQRLNTLLSEVNQAEVARLLVSLRTAAAGVSKMAAALQPTVNVLPIVVQHTDEAVRRADLLISEATSLTNDIRSRAGALDRLGAAAQQVQTTARALDTAVVGGKSARARPLVDEVAGASRVFERAAADLRERPQSFLFGRDVQPPGPGESGFEARQEPRR